MKLPELPDRRRKIYVGNTPLEFLEQCHYCSKTAIYRGKCLSHYSDLATMIYNQKQAAYKRIARYSLPVLLPKLRMVSSGHVRISYLAI